MASFHRLTSSEEKFDLDYIEALGCKQEKIIGITCSCNTRDLYTAIMMFPAEQTCAKAERANRASQYHQSQSKKNDTRTAEKTIQSVSTSAWKYPPIGNFIHGPTADLDTCILPFPEKLFSGRDLEKKNGCKSFPSGNIPHGTWHGALMQAARGLANEERRRRRRKVEMIDEEVLLHLCTYPSLKDPTSSLRSRLPFTIFLSIVCWFLRTPKMITWVS